MNYGRTKDKKKLDQLFEQAITEGEGTAPENSNPDIAESLHSTDDSISWEGQAKTPNISNLGKTGLDAISNNTNSETALTDSETASQDANNLDKGSNSETTNSEKHSSINTPFSSDPDRSTDIIPPSISMEMPPGVPKESTATSRSDALEGSTPASILSHIHLDSHHKFTEADVKLVDEAISASGDDISSLYDAVRSLTPITHTNQTDQPIKEGR